MSNAFGTIPINLQEPLASAAEAVRDQTESAESVVAHKAPATISLSASDGRSLKQSAVQSSLWTLAGYGGAQAIRLVSNFILARLLLPESFGLAMSVGIVLSGLQQLSDVGVGPAIIQNPRGDDPRFLNTAWTMSLIRGIGLWIIACAISVPAARFFRQPLLVPLFLVSAINTLINGLNSTSLFTLNRHLKLRKITLLGLSSQAFTTIVMILIALRWPNAWAIILAGISQSIFVMVVSHWINPGERNRLAWDPKAAHELFKLGKWIFVSTLLTYFASQADSLMLPRLFGEQLMGIYCIALTFQRIPTEFVSRLANMTVFPALVRSAEGPQEDFRKRVLLARKLILPCGIAAMVALGLGAPVFYSLYKQPYWPAGWICQFLVLNAWAQILQLSADRALLALGRSRPLAASNAANFAVTVIACLLGKWIGTQIAAHYPGQFTNAPLQGYIIGAGLGNLAGHVTIQYLMARRGILLFYQDFAYTLLLSAALAIGLLPKLFLHGHGITPHPLVIAWDVLIGMVISSWAGLRVLNYVLPNWSVRKLMAGKLA